MHSFWVLFKQLCRAGRLAPDSRLLQVCASTAATIGALSYFSCRNKTTIFSVAKDIVGSLCTSRGDSGRRWRGGRRPQEGERNVALINLTRFSFTDNLCIFWATTTTWVYLRVWNDLELSCTNGRQRGVFCFTVQFFDFFVLPKKQVRFYLRSLEMC